MPNEKTPSDVGGGFLGFTTEVGGVSCGHDQSGVGISALGTCANDLTQNRKCVPSGSPSTVKRLLWVMPSTSKVASEVTGSRSLISIQHPRHLNTIFHRAPLTRCVSQYVPSSRKHIFTRSLPYVCRKIYQMAFVVLAFNQSDGFTTCLSPLQ